MTRDELMELGYSCPKQLADGQWVGLRRMLYTVGLFVGLDEAGYKWRFCYPDVPSAVEAIVAWDGTGDPPGPWIKQKGHPGGERNNPALFKGVRIVEEARDGSD